jgi:ferredoxin-nitrite reductase
MPDLPTRAAPDWDLVLKRNNVERLKRDKFPLEIKNEIDELAQKNYLDISEEDMVRFQWYGLYQDKPKVGYFMLRVKAPSGIMTAAQYRVLGELSVKYGRNYTELSTRQNVQLHWLQIAQFNEVFAEMDRVGMTSLGCTLGAQHTGCPVAGLDADELFDARPELDEVVQFFLSERDYFDLPRKHKITISSCVAQCNAPEINCIVFIGTRQDGREGYALRVGGGLSSTPRLARELGVFVPRTETREVAQAILDVWRTDLKYRMSRAKARLKFLVDDYGPEGVLDAVQKKLGRTLEPLTAPPVPRGSVDHLGTTRRNRLGCSTSASLLLPRPGHWRADDRDCRRGGVAYGGDVRLARSRTSSLSDIPEARVDAVVKQIADIGFPLDANGIRSGSIGCTGSHCATTRSPRPRQSSRRSSCGWKSGSGRTSRTSRSAWTVPAQRAPTTGSPDIGLRAPRRVVTRLGQVGGARDLSARWVGRAGRDWPAAAAPRARRAGRRDGGAIGGGVPGRARRGRVVPGICKAQE